MVSDGEFAIQVSAATPIAAQAAELQMNDVIQLTNYNIIAVAKTNSNTKGCGFAATRLSW